MVLRIVMIILLLSGSVCSQSKVGATGTQFLQLSTSVRSAGMADIGVMFDDGDALYYNPAVIGLVADEGRWHLPLTVTPNRAGTSIDYYSTGIVRRPSERSHQGTPSFGMAVDFLYMTSGPMVERTYDQSVDGIGNTFSWEDYKVGSKIGLGWSGRVDFGVGLAFNWIGEYVYDYSATSWSVDVGTFLAVPLSTPGDVGWQARRFSLGISYSNLGPDLKFIEKVAPIPKVGRVGAAVEFSRVGDNGRVQVVVLPAIEYELCTTDDGSTMKFGLELTYREIVSGRAGYRTTEYFPGGHNSYGLSLSTLGLRNSGENDNPDDTGFFRSLVNKVIFEFHYAHIPPSIDPFKGIDHFGFGLTF